jgi:hypothetical protein
VDSENNDSDTLQLKDELDKGWVKLWRKTIKKIPTKTELTINCIPTENAIPHYSHRHHNKTL